jgi:hypothetical protein
MSGMQAVAKCSVVEPLAIHAELVRNLSCPWYNGYPDMDFTIRIPLCYVRVVSCRMTMINIGSVSV